MNTSALIELDQIATELSYTENTIQAIYDAMEHAPYSPEIYLGAFFMASNSFRKLNEDLRKVLDKEFQSVKKEDPAA